MKEEKDGTSFANRACAGDVGIAGDPRQGDLRSGSQKTVEVSQGLGQLRLALSIARKALQEGGQ